MYYTITAKQYLEQHQHIHVVPSMSIQTIKMDKDGFPDRAKTCIVALGNHEELQWQKSNKFAPVLRDKSSRDMTSVAVQLGQHEKQGDFKNTSCQLYLPKDEMIITRPPKGCPLSKPVTYRYYSRLSMDSATAHIAGTR